MLKELQNFNFFCNQFSGIKKEAVKPARGLTKQKATSTLQKVSEVTVARVTRRSAEQKNVELMEQDEVKIF